jgi:DNA replication protein DnaC
MTDDVEAIKATLDRVMKKAQAMKSEGDDWARETNEAFEERQREEWRRPRLAAIPEMYAEAEVGDDRVQAWLSRTLDGGKESLCLAGPTGTGKSYMLWAIYRLLIDARVNAIGVNLIEYLEHLRPGGPEDESLTIEKLVRTPVLLMDDLGVHKSSEWTDDRLYYIVNNRYEHLRPTVVTTNVPVKKWVKVFGERIGWRMIERFVVVEMTGPNRRER